MTQTIHRAIGAAATAVLLSVVTASCGDAGGGAVGGGVAVPAVATSGSAAGEAPVLSFTVRPEAATASLDLLWRVEVTPSTSSSQTSPVAAAAASILSITCEVNRLPVFCLRVDVNAYEIRHRATPGDVHLEVLVRTASGDLLTATSDHVVAAAAVDGPALTFVEGPEAGGGLRARTRFLSVSFRVASDRLLASAGLSCAVNSLPVYCALELPARTVIAVSGAVGGEGSYQVSVTGRDQMGYPTTVTRAFTVDRTAPVLAMTGAGRTVDVLSDAAGFGCFAPAVTITGEATGWRYDAGLSVGAPWVNLGLDQTAPSFCRLYGSSQVISAAAFDDVGNQSPVVATTYRILARYQTTLQETAYVGRSGSYYPTPVSAPTTPEVGSLFVTGHLYVAAYAQAAAACASISLGGVTGWRLPTAAEAAGLHTSGYALFAGSGGGRDEIWTSTVAGAGGRATAIIYDGAAGARAETSMVGTRCVRDAM